ncbi:MAG: hypothetical protein HY538_05575 [Deltaproteobacteria bacterium]|nr:hypothetical protein [Deltaproteobacteria bacterium]
MRYFVLLCVLLELAGCGGSSDSPSTADPGNPTDGGSSSSWSLSLIQSLENITTSEEEGGARPEILYFNDQFPIIYRDTSVTNGSFRLKVLDSSLNSTGIEKTLVTLDDDGGVTDIRVDDDGTFVYAAYEKAFSDGRNLFLSKYDASFETLATTLVATAGEPAKGIEALDDPEIVVVDDLIYVITKTGHEVDVPQYRAREFDLDLNATGNTFEISTGLDVGLGNVNSALFLDNLFYFVTTVHISGPPVGPAANDDTNNDLVVLKYNADWTSTEFEKIITDDPNVEFYPTGFKYADGKFYVAYNVTNDPQIGDQSEAPQEGGGILHLKVFDSDLEELAEVEINSGETEGKHPSLVIVGDKIYVVYGEGETDGQGATDSNLRLKVYQLSQN